MNPHSLSISLSPQLIKPVGFLSGKWSHSGWRKLVRCPRLGLPPPILEPGPLSICQREHCLRNSCSLVIALSGFVQVFFLFWLLCSLTTILDPGFVSGRPHDFFQLVVYIKSNDFTGPALNCVVDVFAQLFPLSWITVHRIHRTLSQEEVDCIFSPLPYFFRRSKWQRLICVIDLILFLPSLNSVLNTFG
ncbi:hypothetical protein [Salmon gill poxvirus]|nr:hypothetical protein [Salmon gill poxvirus]